MASTPRVKTAIVPETLLVNSGKLKGIIVRESIAVFFDKEGRIPPRHTSVSGRVDKDHVVLEDGYCIPILIVVPSVCDGRRLVCEAKFEKDELIEALSLFTESDGGSVQVKPTQEVQELEVPEVLTRFCKATSLASHAATTGPELITWNEVSMTFAIRSKPLRSAIGRVVDVSMGIVALVILATYWGVLANFVDEQLAFEDRTLKERVEFVMSKHAPLGFKLNPQVDFVLGNLVILVVDAWQKLISYPTAYGKECVIVSLMTAALINRSVGLSVLYAVVFDVFAVLSSHVGVLHRVISRILRFQLRLIGSLALLMRGKKRNMLRNRVDTLKTDSAQLMLGTMAIFFFSFTLQTTLAYHMLVLAVWSLVFLIQCAMFFICVVLRTVPYEELIVALTDVRSGSKHGSLNPSSFHLLYDENARVWRLIVVPASLGGVLNDWLTLIISYWSGAWTRRWGAQRVFLDVLFGHELPTVPPPDFN